MTGFLVLLAVIGALVAARAGHRVGQRRAHTRHRADAQPTGLNVVPAPITAVTQATDVIRLSDLSDNTSADVVALDDGCQGFGRRRLMDLGFTEGTRVAPVLTTFAGDPRAYQVRGTVIAVRRDQAAHVLVRPVADVERHIA